MDTLHELDQFMKSDSKMSLDGMATTLGINFAITFGIFLVFIILRPNHTRKIYMCSNATALLQNIHVPSLDA